MTQRRTLCFALLLGIAATVQADTAPPPPDPLWTLAQQRAAASRAWVAQVVHTTLTSQEGVQTRTATAVATLSGWEGSTPVRQTTTQGDAEAAQLARRALPGMLSPADRPDAVLLAATVTRDGGPQHVEGRSAQAFHLQGTAGRHQARFTGRVLVDAESGDLMSVTYQFAPSGPMKGMSHSVHFAPSQPGNPMPALPDSAAIDVEVRLPLLGAITFHQKVRMAPWVQRPPQAQVPATESN